VLSGISIGPSMGAVAFHRGGTTSGDFEGVAYSRGPGDFGYVPPRADFAGIPSGMHGGFESFQDAELEEDADLDQVSQLG